MYHDYERDNSRIYSPNNENSIDDSEVNFADERNQHPYSQTNSEGNFKIH